jgi:hypothetical protein
MAKLRTEEYGGGKYKKHYLTGGKGAGKRKAKLKGKFIEKDGKVTHKSGKLAGEAIEQRRKRSLAEKLFGVSKRTTKDVFDELPKDRRVKHTVQKKKIKKTKKNKQK